MHIENPGIVRTAYFTIFMNIQGHSAISSLLRHIKAYWGNIEAYWAHGIKFCINNHFVYVSFTQCYFARTLIRFSKMLLPIGSTFLPIQSKEDHIWIICTFRNCDVYNFILFFLITVCSCHFMYAFQSESTLYICLNIKNSLLETGAKSEV